MTKFYLSLSRYLTVLLLLLVTTVAWSQNTVTGRVTSSDDGSSVPGVNIIQKGTSSGTVTDADGKFSINVPADATLVFSFVGFQSQEVAVAGRSNVDIVLTADVTALTEVVVVGYGEVKKTDATGAVEVVGKEKFNKGFQTSPEQLIQGRVSGVQITSSSGAPGAATNIRIRGASSIRAGNNPLIVLDGVPLDGRDVSSGADVGAGRQASTNPLNFINPNDIESMSVLKDASATAIYGSRGANGVILITTKKGKSGAPQLEFNSAIGTATIPEGREYNLLSAQQFANEVAANRNFGSDVDAFEEITRTGVLQDYNLTYGGATESGRYRISMGMQDQEGVMKDSEMKKYSAAVNLSQDVAEGKVKFQSSILTSYIKNQAPAVADNVGAEGDMLISALRWNPTRPFRDTNGVLIQPSDNERNPMAFLEYYDDNTETSRVFGNISATINIVKGLDYKVNFGLDRSESERRVAVSRKLGVNFATSNGGIGNIESLSASTTVLEHTLNYTRDIGTNSNLNFLAGYSYQQFNRKGSNQRGTNFIIDDQGLYTNNLDFAATFPAGNNSSYMDPKDELQSFFGRLNLSLKDKLLITATMRADGSSRFGADNKYGYFPSAAVAYRLSDESFVPDFFSDLKARVGWGITGNQDFPSGSAQNQYKPLANGSGIQQAIVGNSALVWEETAQVNLGVDFGILNGRITGSMDYFSKKTEDLLFRLRVAQQAPDVFIWRNLDGVSLDNSGFELTLDGAVVDKPDFSFDLGLNLSFFKNELNNVSAVFPDGIITGEINGQGLSQQRAQLLYDGQSMYAFYLPVFTGYDENGLSTFADLNNDGENTASGIVGPGEGDRTFVGNPNPTTILGIRASARWKNLDASLYMNGAFGHQVFDNTALALFSRASLSGGANVDERVLNSGQSPSDSPVPSTQWLEDGDYLRMTNFTVGYTLSDKIPYVKSLRIYATGQNLFVITGYKGFDPEVNINKNVDDVPSFGIDYAAYPRPRVITVGLNFVF